jgi:hypothetical protein
MAPFNNGAAFPLKEKKMMGLLAKKGMVYTPRSLRVRLLSQILIIPKRIALTPTILNYVLFP